MVKAKRDKCGLLLVAYANEGHQLMSLSLSLPLALLESTQKRTAHMPTCCELHLEHVQKW